MHITMVILSKIRRLLITYTHCWRF